MRKIVVTGASGFVGQNVVPYLENSGYECISVSRSSNILTGSNEIGYEKLEHFLKTDESVVAIIHLAGKAHDLANQKNPTAYLEANTELTKKVYQLFLMSSASVFVFISSVKAVADHIECVLTEDYIPCPVTNYGKSKLLAEKFIQSIPLPPNKKYFILRPGMVHGKLNKGNLNLLFNVVNRGIPYPLGSFQNQRSLLSIENLCFVLKELIERKDIASRIYHIVDDIPLSTQRIIQIMAETLSKNVNVWALPQRFVKGVARLGDFINLPLNSERLKKLTENYVVSNERLVKALKKPLPVTSEEGLRKTIKSFLNN